MKCLKIPAELKKEFSDSSLFKTNENRSVVVTEDESEQSLDTDLDNSTLSMDSSVSLGSQPVSSFAASSGAGSSIKCQSIKPFFDCITPAEQEQLDNLFAKTIYVSGSPLSLSESKVWLEFFEKLRPSYKLPSRYVLSTTLLDKEFSKMQNSVENFISEASILSLQCDQWSNVRNDSITNYVVNTPSPVFYKTVHTKSNRHTSEFLKEEIESVLKEIGIEKFLGLITDNGANIKKARKDVKNKYPFIQEYGCICHSLNLLVEDMLKLNNIKKLKNNVTSVASEIKNSHILHARFEEIQKEKKKTSVSLKLPVKTRWNSLAFSLESFLKLKHELKLLVVDKAAEKFMSTSSKSLLLDDLNFWSTVTKLYSLLAPIRKWISLFESDESNISKVTDCFYEIENLIDSKFDEEFVDRTFTHLGSAIKNLFKKRKQKSVEAIHYAANLLDPSQRGQKLSDSEVICATELICQIAECHPKYSTRFGEIMEGLGQYKARHGIFAKDFIKKSEKIMAPTTWWTGLCSTSHLHVLAADVLSLPASTAATERTFSRYGNIHTARRNKLTVERAGKLTFISHNANLLFSTPKEKQRLDYDSESDSELDDQYVHDHALNEEQEQ